MTVNLAERVAEIEETSVLRRLGFPKSTGSFVALTLAEWRAVKDLISERDGLKSQRDHECERANRFYRFCVSNPDVMRRFLAEEEADAGRAALEQGGQS